ncbi:MAG: PTS sugar transporter subunit IIA [Elusimicrobia bacterium]|nr:PTS sugar transporter subunit IIA [Elusimicrobiota bacterium]
MISVVIVTHGQMGHELLRCAEGIVGKQASVWVLGLEPSQGPEAFQKKVEQAVKEMDTPAGVLLLVDMLGGTPCNVALRQCRDPRLHYDVVTGVNLPMLLTALSNRHYMPLEQLSQKLVDGASRNIVRPIQRLRESLKKEGA